MKRRKLIEDFPDFYEMFPIFVEEGLKKECHAVLEQTYNRNHKEAGRWRSDKEKLKKEIIDYCYKNQ